MEAVGTFTLAAAGSWTYTADDSQTAIQQSPPYMGVDTRSCTHARYAFCVRIDVTGATS
jgi:hypothetical protein